MELSLFKTLWGHDGSFAYAASQAQEAGFQGIEGPAPVDKTTQSQYLQILEDNGLKYIAEITTAGSYVPDRTASLDQHVDSFKQKLDASLELKPLFITSLAGCDAWPESKSIEFFGLAMEYAKASKIDVSFETHRSRSFFNPWTTQRICNQLTGLQLTFDFSHWCVVCERLMDSELDILNELAPRTRHIHARIGYDQGPQVPDPTNSRYQNELQSHQAWWQLLWRDMYKRGFDLFTMTPEFGPDGYQAVDVKTNQPIGDLWEYNQWMARQQLQEFDEFLRENSVNQKSV